MLSSSGSWLIIMPSHSWLSADSFLSSSFSMLVSTLFLNSVRFGLTIVSIWGWYCGFPAAGFAFYCYYIPLSTFCSAAVILTGIGGSWLNSNSIYFITLIRVAWLSQRWRAGPLYRFVPFSMNLCVTLLSTRIIGPIYIGNPLPKLTWSHNGWAETLILIGTLYSSLSAYCLLKCISGKCIFRLFI